MPEVADSQEALPTPESDELGRYLEDTITIDWQTPAVTREAKRLLEGVSEPDARVRALFEFVRDEIAFSLDVPTEARTCRASEVLKERTGLCYSKCHLLAGLLRYAGFPTGFCYARMARYAKPGEFVLHAFIAVYWAPSRSWFYLDPIGARDGAPTECRVTPPFRLAFWPSPDEGESFLPFIYKRPAKRIIDLLERAPSFEAVRRNLPDSL